MPYEQIDPLKIRVRPLAERTSYIAIEQVACDPSATSPVDGALARKIDALAGAIVAARQRNASVMLTYGAHLIKNGGATLVNALVEGGWLTHLATQGAGIIHDWEFAYLGKSSESVRDNTPHGRFGTWDETGRWINLGVTAGAAEGLGFGEAIGRLIESESLTLPDPAALRAHISTLPEHPLTAARADLLQLMQRFDLRPGRHDVPHTWKRYSLTAIACRHRVPLTVHPGIGYDIYATHPMHAPSAIGRAAGVDTNIFTQSVLNLTGGVYVSVGSAIMSPQVFEKSLSIANNLLDSQGRPRVRDHLVAIVDLQDGGDWDWTKGEPPKDHPAYYLRFCKTFYRLADRLDYLQGDNCAVLAHLVQRLKDG